jgi:alginate O-acetyltransferase complex protein AlgI
MRFDSLTFLGFLSGVLSVYYAPLPWRAKKAFLLVASYLFYAAWSPPFVILIWISTLVDWWIGNALPRAASAGQKKVLVCLTLAVNLGLLGLFKYGEFLIATIVDLLAFVGVLYQPQTWSIVLPVGISFYTFQTLSYTIDIYRNRLQPCNSLLDFALFVTFFPQLVAGPIVRAGHLLPQFRDPQRASMSQFSWGLTLLIFGLFQKRVLADYLLAPVADALYSAPGTAGFIIAWTGTLAFSGQIYFDFAGYSACAIGIGLCMGFHLPDNFRAPYAAIGFRDFWRRWHITLSAWLRDYLYIPLGGSRRGPTRTTIGIMATMLLGGLWHGAAWRFVGWGLLHGIFLVGERWFRPGIARLTDPLRRLLAVPAMLATYAMVCVAWVFFRADSVGGAVSFLVAMSGVEGLGQRPALLYLVIVGAVTALMLLLQWFSRDVPIERWWARLSNFWRVSIVCIMLLAVCLSSSQDRAFIYFQF